MRLKYIAQNLDPNTPENDILFCTQIIIFLPCKVSLTDQRFDFNQGICAYINVCTVSGRTLYTVHAKFRM